MSEAERPVLHVMVCGSPLAADVGELLRPAVHAGWSTWVVATPDGMKFVDEEAVAEITGNDVRHRYRDPGEPELLPPADAVVVAPASLNTVNKLAAGICDTLVLGLVSESLGRGVPIVVVPYTNRAHAAHPAFAESIAKLRAWGVVVLHGEDFYPFHDPGEGVRHQHLFPWHRVWRTLTECRAVTCPP